MQFQLTPNRQQLFKPSLILPLFPTIFESIFNLTYTFPLHISSRDGNMTNGKQAHAKG